MPHPVIFDRRLLRARRARAAAIGPATFLLDRVADDHRRAAVRGAAHFRSRRRSRHADRCGARALAIVSGIIAVGDPIAATPAVVADEEALPFRDGSLDLVVSALALQFVNDLPGTLIQIRRALKPDGLFLAAMIGGDSLTELRAGLRRRPKPKSRAACRRASRRSPTCAISARCCSARALRCRSPTATAHGALCFAARADARSSPHGRRPTC